MTGRLGAWELYPGTPQAVYLCNKTVATVVNLNICNRHNASAFISVAISTNATTPLDAEWIEFGVELLGKGVLERTGISVSPGQYLIVKSTTKNVNAVCWGIEMGDSLGLPDVTQNVGALPVWVTPATLPDVGANESTSIQLVASDSDTVEIAYSLTAGTLPAGLSLSPNGLISGTPTPGTYVSGASESSSFTISASDSLTTVPQLFSITKKWFDGSTSALAAQNASKIKTMTGTTTSGNYWIKPPGQTAYQVYCDMSNQSGGWMLVAVGRQGRLDNIGSRSWWRDAGDIDGAYATGLQQSNLSGSGNYNPRYMPADWVKSAVGGSTWNDVEMVINRIELADSLYFRRGTGTFSWNAFQVQGGLYPIEYSYYTGVWLTGSNTYSYTNEQWYDTLNNGSPVVNDQNRSFTWTWSGHSTPQYTGWSAGSGVTGGGGIPGPDAGFVVASEGHAIQMVNIFVR